MVFSVYQWPHGCISCPEWRNAAHNAPTDLSCRISYAWCDPFGLLVYLISQLSRGSLSGGVSIPNSVLLSRYSSLKPFSGTWAWFISNRQAPRTYYTIVNSGAIVLVLRYESTGLSASGSNIRWKVKNNQQTTKNAFEATRKRYGLDKCTASPLSSSNRTLLLFTLMRLLWMQLKLCITAFYVP